MSESFLGGVFKEISFDVTPENINLKKKLQFKNKTSLGRFVRTASVLARTGTENTCLQDEIYVWMKIKIR